MANGTISLGTNYKLTGRITWSSSSNGSAANSSSVTANLQIRRTDSYKTTGTFSYYFAVGGDSSNTTWYGSISSDWVTIATKTIPIAHHDNGTGECYIAGKVNGPTGTSMAGISIESSQTVALDTIPRAAELLSAPNFNSTDNPTITYNNPAGSAAEVKVALYTTDGMTCYSGYHTASSTGTSYTFNLTDAEREKLINAVPTGTNNMYVRFYIKTVINGETVEGSIRYLTRIVTVNRAATITSAPNFTDEENPTITYSNLGGDTVTDIQVGIFDPTGSVGYAGYRSIPKTGGSYTFNLKDEEHQALMNAVPIGTNELDVRFYLITMIDGEDIKYNIIPRTFTIANAIPDLSCAIEDIGDASSKLTNDPSTIIRGFNYVTASMTPTLKKGASLVSQSITNGDQIINDTSGFFSNAIGDTFVFSITDSYGQTVTQSPDINFIPYSDPTCNVSTSIPTADGTMRLKINGSCFSGNFGEKGVANELTVKWRIKENNESYEPWVTITPEITDNAYKAEVLLTGLNYKSTYTVQAMVSDLVNTSGVLSIERAAKSNTVYNWGEDNFDINVPLTVDNILCNNIFKGQLELGSYDSKTGEKQTNELSYRCVEPVEIDPDTTYIISINDTSQKEVVLFYDENLTYLSETRSIGNDGVFTTLPGAKYITFRCFQADFTEDYANLNVQIRKASPIKNFTSEVVLYENSSGNSGTVTLNDSVENYKYIDIWFFGNNYSEDYTRVHNPHNKPVNLFTGNCATDLSNIWIQAKQIQISATTITNTSSGEVAFNSTSVVGLWETPVRIKKVVGYR